MALMRLWLALLPLARASTYLSCPKVFPAGTSTSCYASATVGSLKLVKTGTNEATACSSCTAVGAAVDPGVALRLFTFHLDAGESENAGAYDVKAFDGDGNEIDNLGVAVSVAAEPGVMILGTDKGLYKPGQSVLIRALHLAGTSKKPVAGKVFFSIKNPDNFKVFESSSDADGYGVASMTWPLASKVKLGKYSIEATVQASEDEQTTTAASFEVDEYVLPKFEVVLELTKTHALVPSSGGMSVHGTVHGMYTYGEKVPGTVKIQVQQPQMHGCPWCWGGGAPMEAAVSNIEEEQESQTTSLKELTANLGDDMTYDFQIDLPASDVDKFRYTSSLVVKAEIEDAATGTMESTEAVLHLHHHADTAAITMDETVAPGLPQKINVVVSAHGDLDIPHSGYVVRVTRRYGHYGYEETQSEEEMLEGLSGTLMVEMPADDNKCDMTVVSTDWETLDGAHRKCLNNIQVQVYYRPDERQVDTTGTTMAWRVFAVNDYLQVSLDSAETSNDGKLAVSINAHSTMDISTATCLAAVTGGGAPLWSGSCGQVSAQSRGEASYYTATISLQIEAALVRSLGTVQAMISVNLGDGSNGGVYATYATDTVEVPVPAGFSSGYRTSLQWATSSATPEVKPGDQVDLQVTSAPAARVFLLGIDKAVDLLAGDSPAPTIDSATLTAALEERQDASMPVPFAPQVCPIDSPIVYAISQQKGMVWDLIEEPTGAPCPTRLQGSSGPGGDDMMFDVAAMAPGMDVAEGAPAGGAAAGGSAADGSANTATGGDTAVGPVRKFFPETWIFDEVTLGENEEIQTKTFTAPDSITEWRVAAFSTHPLLGFSEAGGMDPLVVKKNLFVQMSLPAFVVQMEKPTVVLTVQNLLAQDLDQVLLTIMLPPGLEAHEWPQGMSSEEVTHTHDGVTYATKVEGRVNIARESFWRGELTLKPTEVKLTGGLPVYFSAQTSSAVGLSDAARRNLIVKPAGTPAEHADTKLVQRRLEETDDPTETFNLPAGLAQATTGSASARLTVVGDIMGNAMANLDRLVTVPTGCGEQNMIGLAPNVYVYSYLDAAGRLGADMRSRLVKNINVGYQRQLMYRHSSGDNSGGFSAFGDSDGEASTWLTAYVLKVFAESSEYVTIDPTVLQQAGDFLVRQQDSTGKFAKKGRVIHEDMMGGASDAVALTAYVAAALSTADEKTGQTTFTNAIANAKRYLDEQTPSSVYTKLLVIRAKALASDDAWNDAANDALDLREGAYWKVATAPTPAPGKYPTYHMTPSLDVEATAYGIQILLEGAQGGPAIEAAQWLVSQQTPRGGWASTQDTVVGLESLAKVAKKMSSDTDIQCAALGSVLQVNAANFDLLQMVDVPDPVAEGEVSVSCTGTGTAVVSLVSQWHSSQVNAESNYEVTTQWLPSSTSGFGRQLSAQAGQANNESVAQLMDVTACATLADGVQSGTSQADYHVFEMGMYSGFTCDPDSVQAPNNGGVINRVEPQDGKLVVYLDSFPSGGVCLTCQATRQHVVDDLAAVTSTVYSYYDQSVRGENQTDIVFATDPNRPKLQAPNGDEVASKTPRPASSGACWAAPALAALAALSCDSV